MKRIPIEKRFWGVLNSSGQLYPHSVSFHRRLAINRFISTPTYGLGHTWRHWKQRGFTLTRLSIEPIRATP